MKVLSSGSLPLGHLEEARRLYERCRAEARDLEQLLAALEEAMLRAPGNDVVGDPRGDAGDVAQQLRRGGVDIDAGEVHARYHGAVERGGQCPLIHIMLIEADANGLRDRS